MAHENHRTQLTHRHSRINEMTKEDLVDVFDMRRVLEAYCIEEAIQRITPDGIEALEVNVKALRRAISINQPLAHRYLINKEFHLIVAEIAGNNAVYRVLEDACEKPTKERALDGFWHEGFSALRHHHAILGAIRNQDIKNAQEVLRYHLDEIQYTLLNQIALRTRQKQERYKRTS